MARKVIKLKDDYSENAILIAISSHENDYRLSWAINESLAIALSLNEDITFIHPKLKEQLAFSRYEYLNEDKMIRYQLISNRSTNAFLFEELKTFDFLLLLTGDWTEFLLKELENSLKAIEIIATIYRPDLKKLKNHKVLDLGI